jgi:arylsulfatase A-like enzyme
MNRKPILLFLLIAGLGLIALQIVCAVGGSGTQGVFRGATDPAVYPPKPKRIILICVDTLRADHVSAFGYPRETTPNIDRMLKREGIGFEAAHSASSWTLPSSVSLMTSLRPDVHEVEDREQTLHPDVPTLAGAFSRNRWDSAAFITHIYVSSLFGINSGFDEFHELSIDWKFREGKQLRANELNQNVFPWLEANRDKSFFLYLHYFDPHWDYDPPAPYNTKFVDPAYVGPASGSWQYIQKFVPKTELMPDEDLEHVIALYDGEIAFTDHHLGKLFEYLKSLNMWEDTLLVLLADHGEELQDHGSVHHIRTLYEEVLHVPLIFKLPGGRPKGWPERVRARVSTLDVAPTLLDIAGIDIPKSFQGKSLLSLLNYDGPDRIVFARTMRHRSDSMALIDDGKKLIMPFGRKKAPKELYRLDEDPFERQSVVEDYPMMVEKMSEEIDTLVSVGAAGLGLPGAGADAELTDEQKKMLKALGYMQ